MYNAENIFARAVSLWCIDRARCVFLQESFICEKEIATRIFGIRGSSLFRRGIERDARVALSKRRRALTASIASFAKSFCRRDDM